MTPIFQRFLSTTAAYLPTTYNAATTRYDNMPFRRAGRSGLLVISTKAGFDMWPGPYGEWGSRKYLIRKQSTIYALS